MHKSHGALNSNEKGDLQHEGKTIDKVFHKAAFDETIVKFLKWQKKLTILISLQGSMFYLHLKKL